ncbi:DUF6457 domain-containing protein [Candidatus Dormibacter sp.]|uniref:DUF6457 domain-containing protein n=1 Tax=Candidatus Dormibacter sp. TaxID=2973982 RepID=UPI003D9BC551
MNPVLDDLSDRLAAAAERHGGRRPAPRLTPDEARELLELARVVAHSSERRFAPLATYLAGCAAGRLASTEDAAVFIREVREELESEQPETV